MTFADDFAYTDEQWAEISPALPRERAAQIREWLEGQVGSEYLLAEYWDHRSTREKRWSKAQADMAKAARAFQKAREAFAEETHRYAESQPEAADHLADEVSVDEAIAANDDQRGFEGQLEALANLDRWKVSPEFRPASAEKPHRRRAVQRVIALYAKLGNTVPVGGGGPSGPLARFVMASVNPMIEQAHGSTLKPTSICDELKASIAACAG